MKLEKNIPTAIKPLIENANGFLRYGSRKKGAYRIQKATKKPLSTELLKDIVEKSGFEILDIVPPGNDNSSSGKYNTWILEKDNKNHYIVFGTGQNAGHLYEDHFIAQLKESKENSQPNSILGEMGIVASEISKIVKSSDRGVKRPITNSIENVGPIISDVDLELKNNTKIHISLKAENGATFANSGYNGGFEIHENSIIASNHDLDDFVHSLGIDKNIAAKGLNDYINEKPGALPSKTTIEKVDKDKIKSYLAAAYGFGYWYVRKNKRKDSGFEMHELRSPEDVYNKIGEINSVEIKYPYFYREKEKIKKSKQISAWIQTTETKFLVEIRNSQGNILPNEIKVKVAKSK